MYVIICYKTISFCSREKEWRNCSSSRENFLWRHQNARNQTRWWCVKNQVITLVDMMMVKQTSQVAISLWNNAKELLWDSQTYGQLGSCSWRYTPPTSPSRIPQPPALLVKTSYWKAIWNSHMVFWLFSNLADDCKSIALVIGLAWPLCATVYSAIIIKSYCF